VRAVLVAEDGLDAVQIQGRAGPVNHGLENLHPLPAGAEQQIPAVLHLEHRALILKRALFLLFQVQLYEQGRTPMRLISTILMACLAGSVFAQQLPAPPKAAPRPALTLSTTAFEDGGIIPNRSTGVDAHPGSPMLEWTNVPAGVVTFVTIMHDTDVAAQKKAEDNLHWMVFNIPASTAWLPEGVPPTVNLPDGAIQAKSSRGAVGYMAPGAPAGPYSSLYL